MEFGTQIIMLLTFTQTISEKKSNRFNRINSFKREQKGREW